MVLKLPWFREKFASENAAFCISAWCLRKLDKEDEKISVLPPSTPSWISNRNSGDRTTLNVCWLCLSLRAQHRLFSRCFLRLCSSGSAQRILWSGHQPLTVTGLRWWINGQGITEPEGSRLGMQAENVIQQGCCQGILSCLVVFCSHTEGSENLAAWVQSPAPPDLTLARWPHLWASIASPEERKWHNRPS